MFGYLIINKPEMKFREFDIYRSYYCGLCRALKQEYGLRGQITLSYDLTFLVMLLTGVYEPQEELKSCRCVMHPATKHPTVVNEYTRYAAAMNILLAYYKAEDDWKDEKKIRGNAAAMALRSAFRKASEAYPAQAAVIRENLDRIHEIEEAKDQNLDAASGCFGNIMSAICTPAEDVFSDSLHRLGFYLGKFIYLMDACDDIEEDLKKGTYNPFKAKWEELDAATDVTAFDDYCNQILNMMMSECSRAFEILPILKHIDILRNIVYSGVFCRFEFIRKYGRGKKINRAALREEIVYKGIEN